MKFNRFTVSLFAIAVVVGFSTKVKIAGDDATASTPRAPAGYVLVEEDQWYVMADEPNRNCERAREAFLMVDAETAANEFRKAAIHLRIASSNAADRTKRGLIQSEHELEQTARRIEEGTVKSVDEIDAATARAMHRLSDYQHHQAAEAWRKKDARRAGQYLRAAANNVEHAAARTEARMKAATAEVARESRVISGKMISGVGYVVDDVGAGFDAVGHQIERVGARVTATNTR